MIKSIILKALKLVTFVLLLSSYAIILSATQDQNLYPFKKGEMALTNGVTWVGPTEQVDYWHFFQASFDQASVDLSQVAYLAIQVSADKGTPGLTFGVIENGDRYATAGVADNTKDIYFMNEDGSIESLGKVMYGAVWIPEGKQGALILPMDSLGWQWNNNGSQLLGVQHFYITTNSMFNNNFEISIGEIGYYTQTPQQGGTLTKLLDLSIINKPNKYYYDSPTMTSLKPILPTYPNKTSDTAFNGGVTWGFPGQTASANDTWQALFLNFETPVDITEASYLAIQYRVDKGAPGMTVAFESGNDRYATHIDTKQIYMMKPSGQITPLVQVLYGAISAPENSLGTMLIPMDAFVHQFGPNTSGLNQVKNVLFTTNSKYNFNWQVSIGAIGIYKGVIGDAGSSYQALPYSSVFNAIPLDTTTETINVNNYPLSVDEKAFNGGQTWTGPTQATAGDSWETLFVNFKNPVDLTQAEYLAVQYRADQGMPGLTFGLENKGTRYATIQDGLPIYFMNQETFAFEPLANILYGAGNIPQGSTGLLLIPMTTFKYQFGNVENTLTEINNFVITTNALYNYNYQISINKVGYFDGHPEDQTSNYVPIDVEYFYNAGANSTMSFIDVQDWQMATETVYPFRVGEQAFQNGKIWVAPATANTVDDYQMLSIRFDQSSYDLSQATYLAIQVSNVMGSPGLTYQLVDNDKIYSVEGVEDGQKIYYIKEDGTIHTAANVLYSAVTTNISSGTLLIPMSAMDFVSESSDLKNVSELRIITNRRYNYNFQFKVGEVGFYTGEIADDEIFTKMLDLSTPKNDKFTKSGLVTNEFMLIETFKERTEYGDTVMSFTATGKSPSNFGIWSGGSFGLVQMTIDSYNDTAIKVKATGSNPTGDAYTAIDIAPTGGFSWANYEGITFWARNDSQGEVSFNIEVDNRIIETGVSDRFNIKQGHRYYLYDVNTNKTMIYMTKPTATLPVGFEGWVRIPFDAFFRADWSNNGVTKDQFMKTGTTVTYLAITIHSTTYLNMEFSLNKFGAYGVDPSFISSFVTPTTQRKSILELMAFGQED